MASKATNSPPLPDAVGGIMSDIGSFLKTGAEAATSYFNSKTATTQADIVKSNNDLAAQQAAYKAAADAADKPAALSFSDLKITPTYLLIAAGGIFVLFNALRK